MRRALALGALLSATPLWASSPNPTPPARIDQLIYVYSPRADWNRALASDNANALLAKIAAQHGIKVVLMNADKMLSPDTFSDDAQTRLLRQIRSLTASRNTILYIATHGEKKKNTDKTTDTRLSFFNPWFSINYSDFAKVVDSSSTIKAVLLHSCHGFCDTLKASANKSGGKLVAASSSSAQTGDRTTGRILTEALGKVISSQGPVRLGPDFYSEIERFLSVCENRERNKILDNPTFQDATSRLRGDDENLFRIPSDYKAFKTARSKMTDNHCPNTNLTIEQKTNHQLFYFGGKDGGLFNAFNEKATLCKSLNTESDAVYLPGVTYRSSQVGGIDSDISLDINFLCEENGKWRLTHSDNRRGTEQIKSPPEDTTCTQSEHSVLDLSDCETSNIHTEQRHSSRPEGDCHTLKMFYRSLERLKVDISALNRDKACLHKDGHLYPVWHQQKSSHAGDIPAH